MGKPVLQRAMWENIAMRVVMGQRGKEIAEALRVSPCTVSNTINNPLFMEVLDEAKARRDDAGYDAVSHMRAELANACHVVSGAMNDPEEGWKTRLTAAKEVLKIAGPSPSGLRPANVTNVVTFEQRVHMAERGQVIDETGQVIEIKDAQGRLDVGAMKMPAQPDQGDDAPHLSLSADRGSELYSHEAYDDVDPFTWLDAQINPPDVSKHLPALKLVRGGSDE